LHNEAKPYVYKLTHPATGEFYIGSRTANKKPAELDLPRYQTSSKYLKNRFDEFDWKIVMVFSNKTCAYDYEQYLINEEWGNPKMLNRSCFYNGKRFSSIGVDLNGDKNPFFGKKHSEETINKIKAVRTGSKMSEEAKRKISESLKGNQYSKGYKPTAETLEKLRIASTGRKHSEEAKQKISAAHKGIPKKKESVEKQRAKVTGKRHTDEAKEKCRLASLGNSHSKGMHWYTNGVTNKTAFECPEGFWLGRTGGYKPREKKPKPPKVYNQTQFSDPLTHADNIRQANIGLRFWNNGEICVRTKDCPEGFKPGMLPRTQQRKRKDERQET